MDINEKNFEQHLAKAVRRNRRPELKSMFAQFEAEEQPDSDASLNTDESIEEPSSPVD